MIAAAIIVLREVIEAALVIGIVLAATRGVESRGRHVAGGVALGLLGAILVAIFAEAIAGALEGMGQEIFNASVLLTATAMLGWHNVWMKRHGAEMGREMKAIGEDDAREDRGDDAIAVLAAELKDVPLRDIDVACE